jgi:hypothetical protein
MSVKTRLDRLESLVTEILEPIKVNWFCVVPGHIDDPIGYTADTGEVVMRKPGESINELQARSGDSVVWVPGEWHLFEPILP